MSLQGLGVRDFAKKVEVDPGFLSGVLTGKRCPPLKNIEKWAEALELSGESRRNFVETGNLTHCPDIICDIVSSLKAENKRLRAKLVDSEATNHNP